MTVSGTFNRDALLSMDREALLPSDREALLPSALPPSDREAPAPSSQWLERDDLADLVGVVVEGAGRRVGYRVDRVIGGGGQAVVLLATRLGPCGNDLVALKVYRPSFVRAHPAQSSLVVRKESVALARLSARVPPTPFVVRLLDQGEIKRPSGLSVPWLALEYVHGGAQGADLHQRVHESIRSEGTGFSPARARRVLGCVASGLAALHALGVVHRDLKPSNVLVCGTGDDELAKVADLGVARPIGMETTFGASARVGEPGYSAPEQHSSARVGPWSDVFSLAAITYLVITGESMFGGSRPMALASAFRGVFEPLGMRPNLHPAWTAGGGEALAAIDDVLKRAVVRDVATRTDSAPAFWAALDPWLALAAGAPRERATRTSTRETLASAVRDPWSFKLRHAPAAPLGLRTAAIDPDGHAMAASAEGLWYWEGASWIRAVVPDVDAGKIRRLIRLGPVRWASVGDGGDVAVLTPSGCEARQSLGPPDLTITAACASSDRHFAFAGSRGGSAVLHAFRDGVWWTTGMLHGLTISGILAVSSMDYVVAGWSADGMGHLWSWRPGSALVPRSRHAARLLALAPKSGGALATGERGFATLGGLERATGAEDPPGTEGDLSCVATDPAGTVWAAARGQLLRRAPGDGPQGWSVVWADPARTSPFVSLAAFSGMVLAVAADGAVVTGYQGS